MKKVFFTVILSFLFVTGLQAQSDIKIGVTGGLITSRINNKLGILGINLADFTAVSGTGFYVGAIGNLGITEKFAVQPELVYAKAGDLEYVQLPIMVKYYVIDKLYAQAGPQFNISTNASKVKDILELISAEDAVKSLGIDIGFGAGYDILENLAVQARFSTELTNRYDGPGNSINKLKASSFILGAAYFF